MYASSLSSCSPTRFPLHALTSLQNSTNRFANLRKTNKPVATLATAELDNYLKLPVDDTVPKDGVLAGWVKHAVSFPRLSQMALDYLSISGRLSQFVL